MGQTAEEPPFSLSGLGRPGLRSRSALQEQAWRSVWWTAMPTPRPHRGRSAFRRIRSNCSTCSVWRRNLSALGLRAVAGNIYAESRRLVHLDLSRVGSCFPYLLLLEQTETERILTEALARAGVRVERGVELLEFKHDSSNVQVRLSKNWCRTNGCEL